MWMNLSLIATDQALFSSENCWYLSYFSTKTFIVGTQRGTYIEYPQYIFFHGEIRKISCGYRCSNFRSLVECSNGAVETAFDIQVDGKGGPGRPKMTWKQLTERDCREWKLSDISPHGRHTWRSGVRSDMRAASQLSGRGPTGVDVAPVSAR